MRSLLCFALHLLCLSKLVRALNVVLAGGTGRVGRSLAPLLHNHDVCILSRNAFLAAAPGRVTEAFGYVGAAFLNKNRHVRLRDWDGGDMLEIVGQDWVGWQEDALANADVVVHLVGGFTEQRTMACERIVRESLRVNKNALQVTVSPREEDLSVFSPGMASVKKNRLNTCEEMVRQNCLNSHCLRLEPFKLDKGCEEIRQVIEEWAKRS